MPKKQAQTEAAKYFWKWTFWIWIPLALVIGFSVYPQVTGTLLILASILAPFIWGAGTLYYWRLARLQYIETVGGKPNPNYDEVAYSELTQRIKVYNEHYRSYDRNEFRFMISEVRYDQARSRRRGKWVPRLRL